jgi:hypothetical protein
MRADLIGELVCDLLRRVLDRGIARKVAANCHRVAWQRRESAAADSPDETGNERRARQA